MYRKDGASHLLEHCIGSLFLKEYVKFLNHSQTFEARCLEFYTQFSFAKKEDLEEFLPLLSQKIKKADFEREKQRLEDELIQASHKLELINKTITITILSLIRIIKSTKSIKIISINFLQ